MGLKQLQMPLAWPEGYVSVSSNGSLGLKLIVVDLWTDANNCFSILERIVGVETHSRNLGRYRVQHLVSVSSNGSLGLKP